MAFLIKQMAIYNTLGKAIAAIGKREDDRMNKWMIIKVGVAFR